MSRFGFFKNSTGGNRENRAGFLSPFSLFPPVEFKMRHTEFRLAIQVVILFEIAVSAKRNPASRAGFWQTANPSKFLQSLNDG
jgi:hypothetical protein